jgi:hypothetical protein
MIGALNPAIVAPAPHVIAPVRVERLHFVAFCGACGTVAGNPMARICSRTDCALTDRSHERLCA